MMAFDPEAPGFFLGGLAENGKEVELRVTNGAVDAGFFEFCEDGLQAHDGDGFGVSLVAEARGEQGMCKEALFLSHLLDGQSFSRPGDEVPIGTFCVCEFKRCLGLLFGGKCGQPVLSGACHFEGGFVCAEDGCGERGEADQRRHCKGEERFHQGTGWGWKGNREDLRLSLRVCEVCRGEDFVFQHLPTG